MKYLIYILSLLFLFGSAYGSWDLIVSEVYLKGNADWIEISNIGDETFTGTITLSGATTPGTVPEYFDVDNLVIISGQAVVIARYAVSSYSYFQNIGVIGAINSKLTLSATGRNIGLWYQGTLLDQFIVDYQTVHANDTTTSFSKKDKFGSVSVSSNQDIWNVTPGYIASPGTYTVPSIQPTQEVPVPEMSGSQEPTTLQTGGLLTGGPICVQDSTQLKISEIYFGDENHSSFIELQAMSNFQGPVTLSGSLLDLSFTIDVNIIQNGFLVISMGDNGLLAGPDRFTEYASQLNYLGGNLVLARQDGQVLDSVQIPSPSSGKSSYFGENDTCQNIFTKLDRFSPGFDEKFLYYFSGQNSPTQVIINSTGNGCPTFSSQGTVTNNQSIITNNQDPIPSTGQTGGLSTGGLKILSIDLTSSSSFQTITLQSNKSSSTVLSSSSVFRLHSTNRTTNNILNGTLAPGETKQFTGNRHFPMTSNCIELLSGTEIIDTYCYGNTVTSEAEKEIIAKEIVSLDKGRGSGAEEGFVSNNIKITHIDYNPKGNDTNNEKIGLLLLSGDLIDLANLRLKIGSRLVRIYGTLYKGGEQIFTGDYRFPNSSKDTSDIDVSLVYYDHIFDTYFYNPENSSGNISGDNQTGKIQNGTGNTYAYLGLKIKNILPNPIGKDAGKEYISLIFYEKYAVETGITLPNAINLSDGWYVLINGKKKKLTGSAMLDEETILSGKFSIPNKAACIAVGYGDTIFDKLCYDMPKENEIIGEGTTILQSLTDTEMGILGQTSIRQIDNRLCIVYMDQSLVCRNIPAGKTSIKLKNENKLYKNYITLIEGYLKKDWKMLLENTKIGEYLLIFKNAKKSLKEGQQKILIGDAWVDIYNLKEQLALKYAQPSIQQVSIELPQILKHYLSFMDERTCKKHISDDIMAIKTSVTNCFFFE